ncbi:MAG: NADH-quinone oxidoreductase subunit NuoK [Candidatus Omnitrophota bacterium]|nr:NADH-quinone oxidoreductase subunit NuoK [Candidatus Omnitrophota bacterium]
MTIPLSHYLIVSGILFTIGLFGLMIRRNILLILLSIELMLNAANLNFIAGSALHGEINGQLTAFFVMVIAAAEVTIGLAIAVLLFRKMDSVDTNDIRHLKG